jgi:hypothetical protein
MTQVLELLKTISWKMQLLHMQVVDMFSFRVKWQAQNSAL